MSESLYWRAEATRLQALFTDHRPILNFNVCLVSDEKKKKKEPTIWLSRDDEFHFFPQ